MQVMERAEENLGRFLIDMGQAGGGRQRQDGSLAWTIGGSPIDYHNAVVRAHLSPETVDDAIDEVVACFDEFEVLFFWHVTPSMEPANLSERLLAKGFRRGADEVAMALDLRGWSAPTQRVAELSFKEVSTPQDLELWRTTLGAGFGAGAQEADWVAGVYATLGFAGSGPWHHYLTFWDGKAVATMTTFELDNTAGCYFIFTLEGYRKRGIASRMLTAVLGQARDRGNDLAVLAASTMGRSVYEQLGFRPCGGLDIYEYAGPNG